MEYKEFGIDFARRAGEIIKRNFGLGMQRQWKSDNTPVTETDLLINRMLIEEVQKYFPDHDIKGEEEKSLVNNSNYIWVCDPVDGTIPFSHGIPLCTFSLALVEDGTPIVGIVYDPFMDRLFFAEKGGGAFLNGQKIAVSDQATLRSSVINSEPFHTAKYDITAILALLEERGAHATRFASFVYPGVLVAAGEFLADIFPHVTAHDVAALKVIVEEAGGKVTDLFGQEQRYDADIEGAIVSNGLIHDELVLLISAIVARK